MGLFDFSKINKTLDERKNEKYLKEGTIWSCEVVPGFEEMLDRQEWDEALMYCYTDEFIDTLANVFKPYFPNDCKEVALDNRIKFVNDIFYRYSKVYPNIAENAVAFLVAKFTSLKEIPVGRYVKNGKFDYDAFEELKELYNPFLNYIQKASDIYFNYETIETLYNLYEEGIITIEDLLGLSGFKQIFSKDFFETNYLEKHIREAKEK